MMSTVQSNDPHVPDSFLTIEQIKLKVGEFSGIREKMLMLLSDGKRHSRDAMIACLGDPMGEANAMYFQIHQLRKLLRPIGEDVISVRDKDGSWYQLIKVSPAAED